MHKNIPADRFLASLLLSRSDDRFMPLVCPSSDNTGDSPRFDLNHFSGSHNPFVLNENKEHIYQLLFVLEGILQKRLKVFMLMAELERLFSDIFYCDGGGA